MKKEPSPVKLIISGGQSGADLAGNEFAKYDVEIPTRVYTFESFVTSNGADQRVLEEFERINIKVTRPDNYVSCLRERTIHNVKRADATIIFLNCPIPELELNSGSRLTRKMCELFKKPCAPADVRYPAISSALILNLIQDYKPKILNIAGQRTLDRKVVRRILRDVWKSL